MIMSSMCFWLQTQSKRLVPFRPPQKARQIQILGAPGKARRIQICVTVQELCDCPNYTPVTVLTLCDCPNDCVIVQGPLTNTQCWNFR